MNNTSSRSADTRPVKDRPFGPIRWVWSLKLPALQRLVLLALIDCDQLSTYTHQRKGVVWPSKLTLATLLQISPRTITRTMASLEAKGIITRTGGFADKGGAVKYRLNYPERLDTESEPDSVGSDFQSIGSDSVSIGSDSVTYKQEKNANGEQENLARRMPHDDETKITSRAPLVLADARTRYTRDPELDFDWTYGAPVPIDETRGGEAAENTRSTGSVTESEPTANHWWEDDEADYAS